MMKFRFLIIILSVILFAAGCTNKQGKADVEHIMTYEELEAQFISTLTEKDTIAVLQTADSLMSGLKNGDIETSLGRLYMVENNKLVPLSEQKIKELCIRFKRFPVVDYKLIHCVFSIPSLNDLKYAIEFSEKDKNGKAPTMPFVLNPVKMNNGNWYLCIKGEEQRSKDMLSPIHPKTPIY